MPRPKMWEGALRDLAQSLLDAGWSDEAVAARVELPTKAIKNAVARKRLVREKRKPGRTIKARAERWGKEFIDPAPAKGA